MKKFLYIPLISLMIILLFSFSSHVFAEDIVTEGRTKPLTSAEVGKIIAKAANKMYQNRNSFAYNLNNPLLQSNSFKGKKTKTYLCGTSYNYPGNQTQCGMKSKFFVDCSGFCMLATYWSLNKVTPEGGKFKFIAASSLGGSTTAKIFPKLKVGDVIKFTNHYAIYVGNNKMVHMVNNGIPSYQTWTLYKIDVRNWTAKVLGVFRMTDAQAAKISLSKVDENLSKIKF